MPASRKRLAEALGSLTERQLIVSRNDNTGARIQITISVVSKVLISEHLADAITTLTVDVRSVIQQAAQVLAALKPRPLWKHARAWLALNGTTKRAGVERLRNSGWH